MIYKPSSFRHQMRRLKWSNDDLRSKLFDADQRATRLAQNFGFKTAQEAEDSARSPDFQTNVVRLNERLALLEEELRKHIETSKEALQVNSKLREDLKRSQNEVFAPKTELRGSGLKGATASSGSNSPAPIDLQTSISSLQMQLAELQSRYERLSEAEAEAAARHRTDYKKWKEFKDWLYEPSASGSPTPRKGEMNISPEKRTAVVAAITERKANPKRPRNKVVSEPPTPGPSTTKVSDPSDTDDY